ncbi:helix-turn-helix domain-containing protein [Roseomonas chloroacetimidivorans]|uniref:helix-turn-helix domain-containing protein n=1 Tax=Roseomonas chloroacetimidivorans TaxID=1766656 RepID=UPI003C7066F3
MRANLGSELLPSQADGGEMFRKGHACNLALSAKSRQALFAKDPVRGLVTVGENGAMPKRRRSHAPRMQHLRAWRESLGLSRQEVVNKIGTLAPDDSPLDQAALAKWESGETAVRVEDIALLAQVYGVTPDRLFFPPGDDRTPELLRKAHEIITSGDPEAVKRWLAMGEIIASTTTDKK